MKQMKPLARIFEGLDRRHFFDKLPDSLYLRIRYWITFEKRLNLKKPQTFNEKLQWLKLHCRRPEFTDYVDKYKVRQFVAQKIGEKYLIPLLGVWESADAIDFDRLPEAFVLKCNHNSGRGMVICQNKGALDIEKARQTLALGLQQNYYLVGREWPYKHVKRRILGETYMKDGEKETLVDYKVLCFHGKPRLIQVHRNRFSKNYTQDFYDTAWVHQPISQRGEPMQGKPEAKPALLEEMLHLSGILAQGIPHVRVDWYIIENRLFFGEMTFFDASGFDPFDNPADDELLGSWIDLTHASSTS